MSAHLPPSHGPNIALAAGDGKKTHVGGDPKKLSCCGGGGDHHLPKKPGGGPSAAKLALASFLGVIVLLAVDVSLTGAGAGAHRRLRHQYRHYLDGSRAKNASLSWLSVPDPSNFTEDLLARWLTPGGSPCRDARTTNISIPVLDDAVAAGAVTKLGAAEIHEFTFWALDDAGQQSCLGGDACFGGGAREGELGDIVLGGAAATSLTVHSSHGVGGERKQRRRRRWRRGDAMGAGQAKAAAVGDAGERRRWWQRADREASGDGPAGRRQRNTEPSRRCHGERGERESQAPWRGERLGKNWGNLIKKTGV